MYGGTRNRKTIEVVYDEKKKKKIVQGQSEKVDRRPIEVVL